MQNRSQEAIIIKINQFFNLYKRKQYFDLYNGGGYCHGLSLLWLYCIDHQQEAWFYNTIDKLCCANTREDFKAFEQDLEKFIYHIEWLQNSSDYEFSITQAHVEDLLQTHVIDNLSYLLTHAQIKETLTTIFKTKTMLSASGTDHTVGIYKKKGTFFIYDSNYALGKAKEFHSIQALKDELLNCLYPLNAYELRKFPLVFNIIESTQDKTHQPNHFFSVHKKIVSEKKNLNEIGFLGKTDVALAAENGNKTEIDLLLQHGASANQSNALKLTPLLLATLNNFPTTVKSLLDHGADPNVCYLNAYTALMFACHYGFEEITRALLEHNADILRMTPKKDTAITASIVHNNWRLTILLLSRIKSIAKLSQHDIELVTRSMTMLRKELRVRPDGLTPLQKSHCETLLHEIEQYELQKKVSCKTG